MYDELKERWVRFCDMKSDVKTLIEILWYPGLCSRPLPRPDNEEARAEWALKYYESMTRAKQIVNDDRIPYLSPFTGTEIFAEAFGCRVHYTLNNMPFALPKIHESSEIRALRRPSYLAPSLERAFRIARRLKQVYPDALVQLPDIQSPFDIAALIWAKEDFFTATIEEPEAVEELCGMVEEVLVKFLDAWFAEFGREYIGHYPDCFFRGGMTLSEDEAGSISPAAFRRFCLPALTRLSKRYGGIGMHCCANSRAQWDNFKLIPNLRFLNLVQPVPVLKQAYACFADHTTQMHSWCGDGMPDDSWNGYLPRDAHVILYGAAPDEDSAKRLLEAFRALRP